MRKIALLLICLLAITSIPLCGYALDTVPAIGQPVYDYLNGTVTISGELEGAKFATLQILNKDFTFDDISNFEIADEKFLYRGQETIVDGKFTFLVTFDCDETKDYHARVVTELKDAKDFTLRLIPKDVYSSACLDLAEKVSQDDFDGFYNIIETKSIDLGFTYRIAGVDMTKAMPPYFAYLKNNPLDSSKFDDNVRVFNGFILYSGLTAGLVNNVDSSIEMLDFTDAALITEYQEACAGVNDSQAEQKQQYFTSKLSGHPIGGQADFEKIWKQALVLTTTRYADGPDDISRILLKYGSVMDASLGTPTTAICRGLAGNDYTVATFVESYKKLAEPGENGGSPGYIGGFAGGGSGGGGGGGNTMLSGEYEKKDEASNAVKPVKADFTDIEGVDWAVEAILALADKGVINGVEPGIFKPNQNVTREEFVKILLGAMGLGSEKTTVDAFSDVNESDWFYHWVNLATEKGIVNGVGNGMFGTGQPITRQDMSVMICNALTYAGNTLQTSEFVFDDNDAIADYAKSSVSALYKLGAVNGKTETTFEPTSFATRAEAAKIIYGVWDLFDI